VAEGLLYSECLLRLSGKIKVFFRLFIFVGFALQNHHPCICKMQFMTRRVNSCDEVAIHGAALPREFMCEAPMHNSCAQRQKKDSP